MSREQFYTSTEVRDKFPEIVPVFMAAFAGEPWFEVSKCADQSPTQRCVGGLSAIAVGACCETCGLVPTAPAYEYDELVTKFEKRASDRPTVWYTEEVDAGLALAGYACLEDRNILAHEIYNDDPAMATWLEEVVGDSRVAWLHEIFADRTKRPTGNLQNFGAICRGFLGELDADTLAYCTINPRMVTAAQREFDNRVQVFNAREDLPDRRHFVLIR